MKKIVILLVASIFASSCISKKEYAVLQSKHNKTKDELLAVKNSLTKCVIDNEKCDADVVNLNNIIADLKNDKKKTLEYVDNLTVLTQGATDNIKETLAQLSKKDKYINRIRAAATKKDSLNLVVAFNLKKELKDGIDDEDIEIIETSNFESAVTTDEGVVNSDTPFKLKRIKASGKDNFFAFKLRVQKGFRGFI